jgi:formiminoglutamase
MLTPLLDLNHPIQKPQNQLAFALVGFCCDEGIRRNSGRIGAADGPKAIRQALAKLQLHRKNILCYDAGDIICSGSELEEAQANLSQVIHTLLTQQLIPIVMGGGHEMAFGHFEGIVQSYPQPEFNIVNFDAHFDMRPLLSENKGSSGTPFLQIAKAQHNRKSLFNYYCIGIQPSSNSPDLFETAAQYHAQIFSADEVYQNNLYNFIQRILDTQKNIYVSICLDVFASAYAPGVSAPQALGLTPWQVIPALRNLAQSGKVVSYDIAELSPPYDSDARTAKLAAALIYEIIHHHDIIN